MAVALPLPYWLREAGDGGSRSDRSGVSAQRKVESLMFWRRALASLLARVGGFGLPRHALPLRPTGIHGAHHKAPRKRCRMAR